MMPPRSPHQIPKSKRLPVRSNQMTIALGALCAGGVIVAADTRIVTETATHNRCKVYSTAANSGSYAAACATGDENAAATLLPQIMEAVKCEDPKSLVAMEGLIVDRMTQYAYGFAGHELIKIEFALGVCINTIAIPGSNSGGGVALYYCEPPSTIRRHTQTDDSYGWAFAGCGGQAVDPFRRTLFHGGASCRARLNQIAYLMYRAKKDNGAFCGGTTNAVFVSDKPPAWVSPGDMKNAEDNGEVFDFIVSMLAAGLVATPQDVGGYGGAIADAFVNSGKRIREQRFYSLGGVELV